HVEARRLPGAVWEAVGSLCLHASQADRGEHRAHPPAARRSDERPQIPAPDVGPAPRATRQTKGRSGRPHARHARPQRTDGSVDFDAGITKPPKPIVARMLSRLILEPIPLKSTCIPHGKKI